MTLKNVKKIELKASCPEIALGDVLGEGGNARVFAGTHKDYGAVAVKFMLNDNMKRYSRFRDEVLVVTNRLKGSPHVLPILEWKLPESVEKEVPWYAMPAAMKLTTALKSRPWQDRLPALIELADALTELHACSVAHRDIKPENLFMLDETYRFGDFGIAAFPESSGVTSSNEPMGPWSYIAPEMLASPTTSDPYKGDVYSFAKTVWAVLTDMRVAFGGQYNASGMEGLSSHGNVVDFVTEPLDSLLEDSTDSNPAARPSASEFAARLRDVALLQSDFGRANPLQWEAAELDALRRPGPVQAIWEEAPSIARVLSMLSRRDGLNHCFFPEGGGMAIEGATVCEGGKMLALQIQYAGIVVVKPLRLTLERFANRPDFSYAVLDTLDTEPLGVEKRNLDGTSEYLKQVNNFDYVSDDSDDDEQTSIGITCKRYFKGGMFVIAPTCGIYNKVDDYLGTAQKLGRKMLRAKFKAYFERLTAPSSSSKLLLVPLVRLLSGAENPRCEFALEYIDNNLLQRLIEIDDILMDSRKDDEEECSYEVHHSRMLERILAGPSPESELARKLLEEMSPEQCAEFRAIVDVGRGIISCDALSKNTALNLEERNEYDYPHEKLGNGYFRRAIKRFGLEVVLPKTANNKDSAE
jgi:serine/threonine-protein kinase